MVCLFLSLCSWHLFTPNTLSPKNTSASTRRPQVSRDWLGIVSGASVGPLPLLWAALQLDKSCRCRRGKANYHSLECRPGHAAELCDVHSSPAVVILMLWLQRSGSAPSRPAWLPNTFEHKINFLNTSTGCVRGHPVDLKDVGQGCLGNWWLSSLPEMTDNSRDRIPRTPLLKSGS